MKPIKNTIDFLIIGAQKSGTTSLFKYLSEHPCIYMEPGKETDFFSNNEKFSRGLNWYLNEYFNSANPPMLWGEASPQYMCFDSVPERIYSVLPNVKIIAILRNPVDRAYSHYRMAVHREKENRPFEACVRHLIERGRVSDAMVNVEREFILFGEYGRILSNYLRYFSKNQIKVVFMEEMAKLPVPLIRNVYNFLCVPDNFNSEIFGSRFHAGGEKRFRHLDEWVRRIGKKYKNIVPSQTYRTLKFGI